jgi:hypothetical protein
MVRRAGLLAVAAVVLAGVADAQYVRPARMDETGWDALGAPAGCAAGYVPYVNASLKVVCSPTVYAPSTDTLTVGTLNARNLTAIPLPASGSVTVTPKLSPLGGITVVAGSALVDGDSLSVGDGVGVVPIEFDAAPGDGTTGGAVPIIFDGTETATQIRDAVRAILNAAGRDWTTSAQGADGIGLVRATPGATGGAITESVTDAGFSVTDWTDPTHATTYTYSLQACLADGTCNAAGPASSTAAGVATLSAAQLNRLSWSAVPGAASYKIRRDVGGATQGVIWSGTALTVDDTGLAGNGTAKPLVDDTGTVRASNYKTDVAGNVASGDQSQYSLTTGSYNVASGYLSGYISGATPSAANAITTSTNTTFIGYQAGLGSPTQRTNATAIGANAYVDADNTVVLGDGAVTDVLAGSTGAARVRAGTLTLSNLPVYADNAAALGGGLTAGQVYRTSTGVLMVTY